MWKWLKPGLGIKRWIFFMIIGVVLLSLGLSRFPLRFIPPLTGLGLRIYVFVLAGLLIVILGIYGLIHSLVNKIYTGREPVIHKLSRQIWLNKGPRIVALGGGTGLSTLLRGLKNVSANLTAIVAVTDDGGSSGRLRDDFDLPAPGDLRNCIAALAPEEQRLSELFSYRFKKGSGLAGHSLGNIFLTALADLQGGFPEAISVCSEVLAIQGKVLPSMWGTPRLQARLADGSLLHGETTIAASKQDIVELDVKPRPPEPNPEAILAVSEAELLVVGPGSLYTSILTNFIEPELCEAFVSSPAPKVYICNLMTQAGETDSYSVSEHLRVFEKIPPQPVKFDYVFVNSRRPSRKMLEEYRKEGAVPVKFDYDNIKKLGVKIHADSFLESGRHLRHDVDKILKHLQFVLEERHERQ
ncbi:MAG: uridine diphosphate-N-acetylglucosamine-binding protein YvcK [bacterium]